MIDSPYSKPNIVDLSKQLVNAVLKENIYKNKTSVLDGIRDDKKILFFLLDGLGSYQLEKNEGILLKNRTKNISTTFPSTTNVVLTSFCTASTPREHGVLSYLMFDDDFGGVFNALVWNKIEENRAKAENYLQTKTIWETFDNYNLKSTVFQPKDLSGSTLSKNIYRGANITTYESIEQLFEILETNQEHLSKFTFVYYPPIDLAGHVYGSNSREYIEEIKFFEKNFENSLHKLKDFTVVLTADHGMVDVEKTKRIKVDSSNPLIKFFGDNRSVFINGDMSLADELLENIPGKFIEQDVVHSLLGIGTSHSEYELRSPQLCFLPDEDFAVIPSHLNDSLTGYHGGITGKEMTVPLIIFD
jgi:hypothetical protein